MRVPTDTNPTPASVVAMKSSLRMLIGRTGLFAGLAAIFAFAEHWLATVLGDDLIATILLLIATIVIIALLAPLLSKTGR